jgi:hypothetical protein
MDTTTDVTNILDEKTDVTDVRHLISNDLKQKLNEYQDPKKGLKAMSALMGIHDKTLKRLIECENKASSQTILKIYRALYNTSSNTTVIELLPPELAKFVEKNQSLKNFQQGVEITLDVDSELQKSPIFCEIYLLAATGGISKEYIAYNYGKFGERILQSMVDSDVLAALTKYKFVLGRNQASFTPETIKTTLLHAVDRFAKVELSDTPGQNYQSFLAAHLNEDAYDQWIKIEKEANTKKIELAKNPANHGDIKTFTYSGVDTLVEAQQDKLH